MEIKRRLKKVEAEFISLVGRGANNKIIIFKSAQSQGVPQIQKEIEIKKIDEDQRMVYGVVYSPEEVDLQGDIASAEVIKDMAYNFMKSAKTNNVDQQHNFISDEGFVAESWLVKQGDPVFPQEKEGSWAVGIKIEKDETWRLVKGGEISGLSLAGLALVEDMKKADVKEKTSAGFFEKIKNLFSIKKIMAPYTNQEDVHDCVITLEKTVDNILAGGEAVDKKTAILESISKFIEALGMEEAAKGGKAQDEIVQGFAGKSNSDTISKELRIMIDEITLPLNEKIAEMEVVNKDFNARLDAIEKYTPGSRQSVKKVNSNPNQIPIWT